MPEPVEAWWSRRQRSKGVPVPYEVGRYRGDWERYPVLIRQYHPDLNHGITLTQVPPAAEVYLLWECETGHRFVATPEEQRARPNGSRRRSTWCPECASGAVQRSSARRTRVVPDAVVPGAAEPGAAESGAVQPGAVIASAVAQGATGARPPKPAPAATTLPCGHPLSAAARRARRGPATGMPSSPSASHARQSGCRICRNATAAAFSVREGEAFVSPWAPKPASAAEADLRQRLHARFALDLSNNAVRVARPFFEHLEVWPDFVLPDLRVAIEYDTTGRDGLEHVGQREIVDRRKDRLLRQVGWEVVRIRCGKLQPLGRWDVSASGVSAKTVEAVIEQLRALRGDLIVEAWLRPG